MKLNDATPEEWDEAFKRNNDRKKREWDNKLESGVDEQDKTKPKKPMSKLRNNRSKIV